MTDIAAELQALRELRRDFPGWRFGLRRAGPHTWEAKRAHDLVWIDSVGGAETVVAPTEALLRQHLGEIALATGLVSTRQGVGT